MTLSDSGPPGIEALAVLEIEGMACALRAQDAALKKAAVTVVACAPVSPGKVVLLFVGDVASVEESLEEADHVTGSRRIDRLFLPAVHPGVVEALHGTRHWRSTETLGVVELDTVSAAILGADTALKHADVVLGRLHLASGFGGKGFFTVWGDLCQVEAAVSAVEAVVGERLTDHAVIAAPHEEVREAAFVRPWPADPGTP